MECNRSWIKWNDLLLTVPKKSSSKRMCFCVYSGNRIASSLMSSFWRSKWFNFCNYCSQFNQSYQQSMKCLSGINRKAIIFYVDNTAFFCGNQGKIQNFWSSSVFTRYCTFWITIYSGINRIILMKKKINSQEDHKPLKTVLLLRGWNYDDINWKMT